MEEEKKKEEERYPYETSAYLVHFDDILKCHDILCEELKNRIVRATTLDASHRLLLARMMNLSGPYIRFSKIVKYLHSREDAADAIKSLRNVGFARTSTKSEEEALSAATSCLQVQELKEVLSILKIRTLPPQTKPRMIVALREAMRTRRTLFGTKLQLGSVLKRTIVKNSDMLIRLDESLCKGIRLCT